MPVAHPSPGVIIYIEVNVTGCWGETLGDGVGLGLETTDVGEVKAVGIGVGVALTAPVGAGVGDGALDVIPLLAGVLIAGTQPARNSRPSTSVMREIPCKLWFIVTFVHQEIIEVVLRQSIQLIAGQRVPPRIACH